MGDITDAYTTNTMVNFGEINSGMSKADIFVKILKSKKIVILINVKVNKKTCTDIFQISQATLSEINWKLLFVTRK